ncbi:MAG: sensor histidine kinase [Verrucomicrobiaceae bacterium]|nr:MAG: sensor histidine kinase [Verrucomicrobiaceae bacterium]
MADDHQPDLLRSGFGDYLSRRKGEILEQWLISVQSDPNLRIADTLTEPLLKDHIPDLLEAFADFLRSGDPATRDDTRQTASLHGAQRWGQGYSIKELMLEIYRLRKVMFQEVVNFAAGQPGELSVLSAACGFVDAFLNDLECRSVERFAEESESGLRKSNAARLGLIRTVSHELRNMLNSVGFAIMRLEGAEPEEMESVRGILERNSTHMKEVLDDLLDLSMVLSRQTSVKLAAFEPSVLLNLVDLGYRHLAETKGLRFGASIKPSLDSIFSDELKIRQITENLVSNAIKYTPAGEVHVSFEDLGPEWWAIVVQDTGVGIAKEDREHIFSEFYQVKSESPLRGSGLGLAIVTGLVDLLNGSIHLESELNNGSVFKVLLPRIRTAQSDNHAGQAQSGAG